ncbi:MAG TPA: 50S ribosomal protein L6 [Candidatus Portnoybacteria bacterium]|jgi:large subunit ribosomal protein L6|nr:50S ribosomal protein L6 [Candidatus Portnoybacteria bacterium]MDD5751938.1 50S ribosomal protein L6 [Candidatus Portnoybacteria bacterium]HOZ16258.1 50S ribosomal protein L6 [Candidatus Portnoybacteria bacterium]HPH51946.1 50S ribosomal protein L6 [Candidatus Portnoybacteria bacterium]HPM28226.1 50S ribosomal protein L6 [Candidatus Portnoybacteria bacterium]
MSRIGKQPIVIPLGVEVRVDGDLIIVKGKKGELAQKLVPEIKVEIKDKVIVIQESQKTKKSSALWGTFRALINNMIQGVHDGFQKKLVIEGIGYKVALNGNKLILSLGFSHPVEIEAPKGIEFKIEKNTIIVSGADKQVVGQTAANIRIQKKPEPYKGKGIRYDNEIIRRKDGKKAVSAGG